MFASEVRATVTLGDVEVVIRKLSGRSLSKAADVKQIASANQLRAFGGEILKALRDETVDAAVESLKAKKADPKAIRKALYDAYDRDLVLQAGIASWNHKKALNPESIADLDEDAAKVLHEAIIDLSIPEKAVTEAVEGNV